MVSLTLVEVNKFLLAGCSRGGILVAEKLLNGLFFRRM